VFTPRAAGRARGFAVDAGGTHGVDEISVGAFVAGLDGGPARVWWPSIRQR